MKALFLFFSSLRLTVTLLAASLVLIFFGTLDQARWGVYHTQDVYFEHLVAVWKYPAVWPGADFLGWLHVPMPGGYLLGPLLVINLLCAHFRFFRLTWRKIGIMGIHAGILLLLIGQLWTQLQQDEYFMWLDEGQSNNYVEHFHATEIVVIEKGVTPGEDQVVSWPVNPLALRDRPLLRHPTLPFKIQVLDFFPSAVTQSIAMSPAEIPNLAELYQVDHGLVAERQLKVMPARESFAQNADNYATAIVEFQGAGDQVLGRWVLSEQYRQDPPVMIPFPPQRFSYAGKTYEVALRKTRLYLPAVVELVDFRHDKYPGTEVPFNFSSLVRLHEPGQEHPRETLIYMNNPLRFAGLTFYQASFGNGDLSSMFQVVRNPAQIIPYVASGLISLGLLVQFITSLVLAVKPRRTVASAQPVS